METNSTQAVKADTTAQEPVVKRLRCGDVREDGKHFWKYRPTCVNGEWWMTPERFAIEQRKDSDRYEKRKAELSAARQALGTRFRCGDTRGDGHRFWQYAPSCSDGQRWLAPEKFAIEKAKREQRKIKNKIKLAEKRKTIKNKLRQGDVREDGKMFWQYKADCSAGECWVTPEEFARRRQGRNARRRSRRATDSLCVLKDRLRNRVSSFLKRKGFRKCVRTEAMLGCTYEEFKAHIESKFLPGMSWANFSDCHIDHLVPLDVADTEEDVYSLSHYTNLRPMWGPDNLAKNAKLPEEHELPINLHPKVKEIWLTTQAR